MKVVYFEAHNIINTFKQLEKSKTTMKLLNDLKWKKR